MVDRVWQRWQLPQRGAHYRRAPIRSINRLPAPAHARHLHRRHHPDRQPARRRGRQRIHSHGRHDGHDYGLPMGRDAKTQLEFSSISFATYSGRIRSKRRARCCRVVEPGARDPSHVPLAKPHRRRPSWVRRARSGGCSEREVRPVQRARPRSRTGSQLAAPGANSCGPG